jgi:hypothetical protein
LRPTPTVHFYVTYILPFDIRNAPHRKRTFRSANVSKTAPMTAQ